MARVKNVDAFCTVCGAVKKMEITGEIQNDETKKWAKCKKCKQTVMIDLTISYKEPKPSLENIEQSVCTEYAPVKTYEIGESIYHKNWDDYGKVISKEILGNGRSSIVVEFKKSGQKKLIEALV